MGYREDMTMVVLVPVQPLILHPTGETPWNSELTMGDP